jgi:hypothetical protein
METEYKVPLEASGKVSTSKLLHDLGATWSAIELSYQGIISRPDMRGEYEEMIRIGKDRLKKINSALKASTNETVY